MSHKMITISLEQYNQWRQAYSDSQSKKSSETPVPRVRGLRMGQHFCNHLKITWPDLYYCESSRRAKELINSTIQG